MRVTVHRIRASQPRRRRAGAWPEAVLLILAVMVSGLVVAPRVTASPGAGLRIVDEVGNTPVVNEGGRVALRVVDGSGNPVLASSWSSDNRSVGKVKRTNGLLRGKAFGFATVTAQTSQGPVSGFIVCARVRRQGGAAVQGDTKTDTGGNVYLSSPTRHVLYKATASSADVFAGQTGVSGYQDGTGSEVRFNGPAGIGVDNRAEGGLYVADTANHCIRKVDFRGRSSLAAGTPGFEGTMYGDENPMSEAVLNGPRGVASVGASTYVTDTENHCVWYVDVPSQRVYLVAGEPGEAGLINGVGRGARLNRPSGVTVNTRGTLLAVADTGNNVIRLIGIAPREGGGVIGEVTTLGQASSARGARIAAKLADDRGVDILTFHAPESVSFDGLDNVYVVDRQTASVVTRGRDFIDRVDLAQVGTLGDPASVTVRRTRAFVLDEAATNDRSALNVVEVGAPAILALSRDSDELGGGSEVVVTGVNFARESLVALGDAEVAEYTVESSTRIRLRVPPQQAAGIRTLTVATRGGVAQVPFRIRGKLLSELAVGEITTIAGSIPYLGDGALATDRTVAFEGAHVAMDGAGNIYIPDGAHNRIRRVDASTGLITTVAGTGRPGFTGDGGPAIAASLTTPFGVAVDASGNLYIADSDNHRIRRVDAATGIITTVAGSSPPGSQGGFVGDGGPATSAEIARPLGVALDGAGNLLISDSHNRRLRKVDAATGIITTVAGSGPSWPAPVSFSGDGGPATAARFGDLVDAAAVDLEGNIYFADVYNHRVRRVNAATGIIESIAGTGDGGFDGDGGQATAAKLNGPSSAALDAAGNVYIAEQENHRVRRVDRATGTITTVAGDGRDGFGGDGGPAKDAALHFPNGIVVDGAGNLLVADWYNYRIRRVDAATKTISTVAGAGLLIGDDGPALEAALFLPRAAALDGSGNLFIADLRHSRVRRVDAASGRITTVAGNGEPRYSSDGPAMERGIGRPYGLAIDAERNVYTSLVEEHRVLRVDAQSQSLSVAAGDGSFAVGSIFEGNFTGDGGPATAAGLNGPFGLAADAAGDLFIVDTWNNRIRRVDRSGVITTVAGGGPAGADSGGFSGDGGPATAASLNIPEGIAFDTAGNLFIADSLNHRIRRVDRVTGIITTVVGTGQPGSDGDGGPATAARLAFPVSLAFDGADNLFIMDRNASRVRRVDASTQTITTVAGSGTRGFAGDGGAATSASFFFPNGVLVDYSGNLLIVDYGNSVIRAVRGIAIPLPLK